MALASIDSKTVFKLPEEELIVRSTSVVAACRSSASFSSCVTRATSVSWPTEAEPRRRTAFGPLRRFSVTDLRPGSPRGLSTGGRAAAHGPTRASAPVFEPDQSRVSDGA